MKIKITHFASTGHMSSSALDLSVDYWRDQTTDVHKHLSEGSLTQDYETGLVRQTALLILRILNFALVDPRVGAGGAVELQAGRSLHHIHHYICPAFIFLVYRSFFLGSEVTNDVNLYKSSTINHGTLTPLHPADKHNRNHHRICTGYNGNNIGFNGNYWWLVKMEYVPKHTTENQWFYLFKSWFL